MGKITEIRIVFGNNNRNVFKPGHAVTGHVILKVSKAAKVFAVTAKIHGFCKTKWSVGSDDKKYYKEKEEYTLQEIALWGGVSNQTTVLPVGDQRKEFSFPLSANCPSSFSSKYGNVTYTLTVTCKFPGGLSANQDCTRPFRVYDMVDLTQNPATAELFCKPLQVKGRGQDDCCLCCYKVNAKVDLTLDKSAYVPGDRVLINGNIENGWRSGFSFTSSGNLKSREKIVEICNWRGHPISIRSRKKFQNDPTLTIPIVAASDLRNCRFISVSYFIKFKITMKGFGSVDVPLNPVDIVIGHRSLPTYDNMLVNSMPSSSAIPSAPQLEEASLPPYFPPPGSSGSDLVEVHIHTNNAPPPSYIEAISTPPQPPPDFPSDGNDMTRV